VGIVAIVAAALGGCVAPDLLACGSELSCSKDAACVQRDVGVYVCVPPAQVVACDGLAEHERCTADQITGRCEGGACFAAICGDGVVDHGPAGALDDPGEACDDGNTSDRDGCSGDCMSNETCGNGITDFTTGERCDEGDHIDHDGCSSACQIETPAWSLTDFREPTLRSQHAMAFDGARQETVMFGGVASDGTMLGDTWVWNGVGWRKMSPQLQPRPRRRPGMAYDPLRQRVVMFGGVSAENDALADTWEWDGSQWHAITVDTFPSGRYDLAMTYDGSRHAIVLFGGQFALAGLPTPTPDFADTWAWDGVHWTRIATEHRPTSASTIATDGRSSVAMAFDPHRNRVVLFGGISTQIAGPFISRTVANDHVWELDSTDWHEITPTPGPASRADAVFTYNPATQRLLLADGSNSATTNPTYYDDIWEWDGTAWTATSPTTKPVGRRYAAAVTDFTRGRVVVFGGQASSPLAEAALWELVGPTWTPVGTSFVSGNLIGLNPRATVDERRGVPIIVDSFGVTVERVRDAWHKVGLLGTTNGFVYLAYDSAQGVTLALKVVSSTCETWQWDGSTWTQLTPATSPSGRRYVGFSRDRTGHALLFGGTILNASLPLTDETWRWDGSTWELLHPVHTPSARDSLSMGYDPIREQTVIFGGGSAETWTWDGTDWTQASPPLSPSARNFATFVWQPVRAKLALVAGGLQAPTSEVWEWSGTTWEQIAVPPLPRTRRDATVVATRSGDGFTMMFGSPAQGLATVDDAWTLRWQSDQTSDTCDVPIENDGDGLLGCADPDCWYTCTPQCPPQTSCPPDAPRCGDGSCNATLETCSSCPDDCGACAPICGDGQCDAGEDCPGDC
jgi:cysteine-rich repeat protein